MLTTLAAFLGWSTKNSIRSGEVPVITPVDTAGRIAERKCAGNAMGRQTTYMYGNLLKAIGHGFISTGLGASLSLGSTGFIVPTDIVKETGETRHIDGIDIEFQMTMGTGLRQVCFALPQFNALYV